MRVALFLAWIAPELLGDVAFHPYGNGWIARTHDAVVRLEPTRIILRKGSSEVAMRWTGGRSVSIEPEQPLSSKTNYVGRSGAVRNLPEFGRLRYRGIYDGVDLVVYGNGHEVEYDFELAAGANPSPIALSFDGAPDLKVNSEGELEAGQVTQKPPIAYQGGRRIDAAWEIAASGEARFRLGAYDRSRPLVIDPVFRADLRGNGIDRAFGSAVDRAGNVYLSGVTTSSNFPVTNAFKPAGPSGVSDIFVAKYSPDLSRRIYSTYFGGSAQDDGTRIQVDAEGNAYVTGYTRSSDFPTTPGAYQRVLRGTIDAFVFKLSADGSRLLYSTLIGGAGDDYANTLLADSSGTVAVAGFTNSPDLPVTADAAQKTRGGGNDVWIAILSADGTAARYLTYYGGSGNETVNGLALGQGGNLYFTGQTESPNLPVDANPFRGTPAGGVDAYLARLSADGRSVEYASYLGGSGSDVGADLTVDFSEVVRVVGNTTSPNFPVFPAGSSRHNGKSDVFVAQFHFPRPAGPPSRFSAEPHRGKTLGLLLAGAEKRPAGEPYRCPYADTAEPGYSYTSPCSSQYYGTEEDDFTARAECSSGSCDYTYRGQLFDALYPDQTECSDYLTRRANRAADDFAVGVAGQGIDAAATRSFCIQARAFYTDFVKTDAANVFAGYTSTDDAFAVVATNTPAGSVERATIGRKPSGAAGHPVSTATGEFWEHELDLSLGGPLPLSLIRYYGSALWDLGTTRSALGVNWMHNFDWRVLLTADRMRALVVAFRGQTIGFVRAGTGWAIDGRDDADFQLVSAGSEFEFFDPGDSLRYSFDAGGRLTRIADLNGNALAVTQGPNGPAEVSDGLGRALRFTYAGARLTEVEDHTGRKIVYTYSGTSLTAAADPLGRVTRYEYTTAPNRGALMTRRTLPEGNTPFTQEYDARGRVTRQSDSAANALGIAYDVPGPRQTQIQNPDGTVAAHFHTAFFYLANSVDGAGNKTGFEYDLDGRQTGTRDRTGAVSGDTFDTAGNLVSSTDALGNTTTHTYTQFRAEPFRFFRRSRTRHPDGSVERFSYDPRGNRTARVDRAGHAWSFTYDERGWLTRSETPVGGIEERTYNGDGTVRSATLPGGETIRFEYDPAKRVSRAIRSDATSRRYAYDATNRLTKFTDERGKEYTLEYDANGRLTAITDPLGAKVTVAWNTDNRLAGLTNPAGDAVAYSYDPVGRLSAVNDSAGLRRTVERDAAGFPAKLSDPGGPRLALVNNAEGTPAAVSNGAGETVRVTSNALRQPAQAAIGSQSLQASYDSMGRITTMQNPLSEATRVRYNAAGLPETVTRPDGSQIRLAYDAASRLTTVVDARGETWTVERDAAGRVIAATDPLGLTTRYEYTARGRLASVTHPDGSSDSYAYDETGNLLLEQYADGVQFAFTRDDVGRVTGSHNLSLAYDANGRIVLSNGIATEYDPAGRIAAVRFAEGRTIRYEYNNRGRLARLTDWTGGVTDFDYDAARRLIAIRRPSGVSTAYSYGIDGRRNAVRHTGPDWEASVEVTRDRAGRIASVARNLPQAPRTTNPLDAGALNLTLTANRRLEGREYDAKGNLARDGERSFGYAGPNLLMTRTNIAGTSTAEYDAARNPTRIGNERYTWNYAVSPTSPAIAHHTGSNVTRFLVQPFQRPLFSLSDDAATARLDYLAFTGLDESVITSGPDGSLRTVFSRGTQGEPAIGSFGTGDAAESRGRRKAPLEEVAAQVNKETEIAASGYDHPREVWQYEFSKGGNVGVGGAFEPASTRLSANYDVADLSLGGFLNFDGEPQVVGFAERVQGRLGLQYSLLIRSGGGDTEFRATATPAPGGSAGTTQPLAGSVTPAGKCEGSAGNVTTNLFPTPVSLTPAAPSPARSEFRDVSRELAGALPDDPATLSERIRQYRPHVNGYVNFDSMRFFTFGLSVIGSDAEANVYNTHQPDGTPLQDPFDLLKADPPAKPESIFQYAPLDTVIC